ncbi:hypothetical protein SAMN05518668_109219 [Sphingobium sp. YR657]|uniref:MFS transporter n=1 Tax=Sphingobium sp. YR657 TaxID=1884366 RepID=UPI00091DF0A3|nr:MFS transporter [Sphingobium sp. YR657]SHM45757.1 hypothetical protein SAMN05518668_109219 [Sphingobium sp. YR657]
MTSRSATSARDKALASGHSASWAAVWGFTGTATPAGWWTWLSRSAPDDAEAGGGLLVAIMQAAIALGAGSGGIVYDRLDASAISCAAPRCWWRPA